MARSRLLWSTASSRGSLALTMLVFCLSCVNLVDYELKAERDRLALKKALSHTEGIVFGSWSRTDYDGSGEQKKPASFGMVARIDKAKDVNWTGSVWEGLRPRVPFGYGGKARLTMPTPYHVFALRLEGGEYSISWIDAESWYIPSDIRFEVIPGQITYVGSLAIIRRPSEFELGPLDFHGVRSKIENRLEEDAATLAARYPDLRLEIRVSLMEGSLGDSTR